MAGLAIISKLAKTASGKLNFTHVLQLAAGGREAGLRQHQTAPALRALAKFDWITPDQADSLITAITNCAALNTVFRCKLTAKHTASP